MGILKNNPLFNINRQSVKVSPFWRFFLREVLNKLRSDIFALTKRNVQLEFIQRNDIYFDSLDFFNDEYYLTTIMDDKRRIPIFIYMNSKEANSLINFLHGNVDVINFDREITLLNKKVIDQFMQNVSKTLTDVMKEKSHDLVFSFNDQFTNKTSYGTELIIQFDYTNFSVFIPDEFYKFQKV